MNLKYGSCCWSCIHFKQYASDIMGECNNLKMSSKLFWVCSKFRKRKDLLDEEKNKY